MQNGPAQNAHEGLRSQRCAPLNFQRGRTTVQRIVTGFAQGNEIVGSVTTCASAVQVMDAENRIVRCAVTMPPSMPVSEEDIFSNVPKTELIALLVRFARTVWILEKLRIEGRCFHSDLRCRQESEKGNNARTGRVVRTD